MFEELINKAHEDYVRDNAIGFIVSPELLLSYALEALAVAKEFEDLPREALWELNISKIREFLPEDELPEPIVTPEEEHDEAPAEEGTPAEEGAPEETSGEAEAVEEP